MIQREQLEGPQKVTWCPGCGNFGILSALKKAVMKLDVKHENLVIVSGIGCSGKLPHYINLNCFHSLHGRAVPVATGVHLVNQDLKVFVHAGDGDCLGEGLGHLLHAARRNVDLAVFIHNNGVMGLTKGQFSPTAPLGYVSKTSPPPPGAPMKPVSVLGLAIGSGATFVARGFTARQEELADLMVEAFNHTGFAVLDIIQPCVTWNRKLTWSYYNERVYSLVEAGHDETDKMKAIERAEEGDDKIPLGILYREAAPDLSTGIALPEDGRLKDHETDLNALQEIIDRFII
ncbi:MAG: 2-oxoacid ferredoxin oxidoreductase [Candidatus Thorarchaeota archaeon]|nr:MAG: 2-oxoacid ferredoxin oxidoreductase [Candidatus Thorarchaeota archaeon]